MYKLLLTDQFKKNAKKVVNGSSSLRKQLDKTLFLLSEDINHPSLRLHKLSGLNVWSVSVNKSVRIICHIEKSKIYLTEIGTHDEVY